MESLYTKYRPQTFQEVVGQQHVVATLERAVLEGAVSHAYLFCGPRGTGKTTMARLLAKALLCRAGPGQLPDGTCDDCQMVAHGEHPDVVEIDAASNTGVDNVRDVIIGRVNYAPVRGGYKVYIVDEVHMLSTAAFNALLKTLEEPPANVVFVLCTTDPQRVPPTILSRVQRFDFHAIGPDDMAEHLRFVCAQEGISIEDGALELVVRQARGGMRDALTALEQLATMTGRQVTLGAARDLFGETSDATLAACTQALARRDVATLFELVAKLVDAGRDLLQFVRELAARLRDVYVVSALGTTEGIVDASGEELVRLGAEAEAFGPTDRVARALTVLGDAASEMRTAPNQRLVLEIAFTRIARPGSDVTLESLAERVAVLEARLEQGVPVVQVAAGQAQVAAPQAAPQVAPPQCVGYGQAGAAPAVGLREGAQGQAAQPTPRQARRQSAPTGRQAPVGQSAPASRPAAARPAAARSATPQGADAGALQRRWRDVVDGLTGRLPSRGSLLQSSTVRSDDGRVLSVSLPQGSSFALAMLGRREVRAEVSREVVRVFGERQLEFAEEGGPAQPVPQAAPQAVPHPAPEPAPQPAPQPTPGPSVPRDASAPAQRPAPVPAPQAPAPSGQPTPWRTAPDEPMPWEYESEVPQDQPAPGPATVHAPGPGSVPAPGPVQAPAPQPVPATQPVAAPRQTPAPHEATARQQAPQRQASAEPLPWEDEPAPATGQPRPAARQSQAAPAQPGPATATTAQPRQAARPEPVPQPAPANATATQSRRVAQPAPAPQPAPVPASAPTAARGGGFAPKRGGSPSKGGSSDELERVMAILEETFGPSISYTIERPEDDAGGGAQAQAGAAAGQAGGPEAPDDPAALPYDAFDPYDDYADGDE